MKFFRAYLPVLSGLAVFSLGVAAQAQTPAAEPSRITAEYINPDKFTDFRDSAFDTENGRKSLMGEFEMHLAWLGKQYLPAGQRLELRFTDIDLAGDFEPWRGPNFDDIRILKDIYAPRMQFEYRLLDSSGAVIRQGSEKLVDLSYLMTATRLPTHDNLRHDKQLLTDWVRREFRARK